LCCSQLPHRRGWDRNADPNAISITSSAAKQEANIAKQQKQIEALTTGLQKVSAQLEISKAAPQTVLNNQ